MWRSGQEVRRTWDATCISPLGIAAHEEIRGNNGQRSFKIASSLRHFWPQMCFLLVFFTVLEHAAQAPGNGNSLSISTTGYEAQSGERGYHLRPPLKDVGGQKEAEDWVSRDNQHSGQQSKFPLSFAVRLRSIQGKSLTRPIMAP